MNLRPFILIHSFPLALLLSASLSAADQHDVIQKRMSSVDNPEYTIQVGAYAEKNYADDIVAVLKRHNFEAFYVKNRVGLNIVLSGKYPTRENARAYADKLVADHLIKEYIIVPFKGGIRGSGTRQKQPEAMGQVSPKNLPDSQKKPSGGKNGITSAIQTPYDVTAKIEHTPGGAIVHASEAASGHIIAHTDVSQGGLSETTQATSQSQEIIEQREHGARVYPAIEAFPPQAPVAARTRKAAAAPGSKRTTLVAAWKQYGAGKIAEAASLFSSLRSNPDISLEATFGLTLCHLARKDFAKALPELEHLVKKRYRLHDTLPELLNTLLELREFQKAEDYAGQLGEKERVVWQRRIEQGIFMQKYAWLREHQSVPESIAFVKEHENVLKQCGMPDSFKSIAEFLERNAKSADAVAIYRTLLSCTKDEGMQLGILYDLKPLIPKDELLKLAKLKIGAAAVTPAHRAKLETFMFEVLRGLLAEEPDQVEKNALAMLKIRPGDQDALAVLGWWYFNKERYKDAYDCFRQLGGGASKRPEYLKGLIYTLMKLDRLDEALAVAHENSSDKKIAALVDEIRLKILWNKVVNTSPDSLEIESLADQILQISPDNEDIRVVRAWWYYKRSEYEKAYQEFNVLYSRNPLVKGYAYGLASSLEKLKRYVKAASIASSNKQNDERLAAFETSIYRELAQSAYERKQYEEAERYFEKVVEADPDDEESKTMLESSKYRKTFIAKTISPLVGLSGHTYGSLSRDVHGPFGNGASGLIQQGIDWVRLPWNTLLRTYGESSYMTRSWEPQYYDLLTNTAGLELTTTKGLKIGAAYTEQRWTRQSPSTATKGPLLYLGWYYDWYKYMHDESDDAGWLNINSFSGSTYGRVSQDLSGSTGTTVSGMVNEGIDWIVLPRNIILNSFAEFRFNLRTKDTLYYNTYGPAVGTELQKSPFKAGVEFYWEHDPEQHQVIPRVTVYLRWYYDWDLKPQK